VLTAGTVQVLHPNRAAHFQLARFGPGEFFGEMALLDDAPRSATAKALSEVEALVLDKVAFHELVLAHPHVWLRLLSVMSRRMRKADEHISSLNSKSMRDPLTGLHNRLSFEERLEEEASRARRYGGSFSLILVDVDEFAAVNEKHGVELADRLLAWVGRLLNEHTRASDVAFRFENDAFTILCPGTSSEVAAQLANRLVTLVAEAKPPVNADVSISVAAGTATCPDHARDGQALHYEAERALLASRAAR